MPPEDKFVLLKKDFKTDRNDFFSLAIATGFEDLKLIFAVRKDFEVSIYSRAEIKIGEISLVDTPDATHISISKIIYDENGKISDVYFDVLKLKDNAQLSDDELVSFAPIHYKKRSFAYAEAERDLKIIQFEQSIMLPDFKIKMSIDEIKRVIEPFANRFENASAKQKDAILNELGDSPEIFEILKSIKHAQAAAILDEISSRKYQMSEEFKKPLLDDFTQKYDEKLNLLKFDEEQSKIDDEKRRAAAERLKSKEQENSDKNRTAEFWIFVAILIFVIVSLFCFGAISRC